jgi:hypothetical protein
VPIAGVTSGVGVGVGVGIGAPIVGAGVVTGAGAPITGVTSGVGVGVGVGTGAPIGVISGVGAGADVGAGVGVCTGAPITGVTSETDVGVVACVGPVTGAGEVDGAGLEIPAPPPSSTLYLASNVSKAFLAVFILVLSPVHVSYSLVDKKFKSSSLHKDFISCAVALPTSFFVVSFANISPDFFIGDTKSFSLYSSSCVTFATKASSSSFT